MPETACRYYVDTSSLAKLYVREPGSDAMIRLVGQADPGSVSFLISRVAMLEMKSLLRLAQLGGRMDRRAADVVWAAFRSHIPRPFAIRELGETNWDRAIVLIDSRGLRPADAIQLSSALELWETCKQSEEHAVFVCSDASLGAAAAAEGLRVLDPARP